MSFLNLLLFFFGIGFGSLVLSRIGNLLLAVVGFKDPTQPLPKDSVLAKHGLVIGLAFGATWLILFSWLGLYLREQDHSVSWHWLIWGMAATPCFVALMSLILRLRTKRSTEMNFGNRDNDA